MQYVRQKLVYRNYLLVLGLLQKQTFEIISILTYFKRVISELNFWEHALDDVNESPSQSAQHTYSTLQIFKLIKESKFGLPYLLQKSYNKRKGKGKKNPANIQINKIA
jgi:hypothetical protein